MKFRTLLPKLMKKYEMSQNQLAKILDLNPNTISAWWNKAVPRKKVRAQIAEMFDVSENYLFPELNEQSVVFVEQRKNRFFSQKINLLMSAKNLTAEILAKSGHFKKSDVESWIDGRVRPNGYEVGVLAALLCTDEESLLNDEKIIITQTSPNNDALERLNPIAEATGIPPSVLMSSLIDAAVRAFQKNGTLSIPFNLEGSAFRATSELPQNMRGRTSSRHTS